MNNDSITLAKKSMLIYFPYFSTIAYVVGTHWNCISDIYLSVEN